MFLSILQLGAVTPKRLEYQELINLLTPNVNYSGRTAPLTSKITFYVII